MDNQQKMAEIFQNLTEDNKEIIHMVAKGMELAQNKNTPEEKKA